MEQKQTDALLVEYKSSASQGVLEVLAILVAMRRWSEKIKGMTLQLAVQRDSITALALTQKLSAKSTSPGLNFIGASCLEELAVEEVLTLHVPGKANVEADFLSRPSTWGDVSMPEALSGVDIEPEKTGPTTASIGCLPPWRPPRNKRRGSGRHLNPAGTHLSDELSEKSGTKRAGERGFKCMLLSLSLSPLLSLPSFLPVHI